MNVISYEKAYCLFPVPTLEERRSFIISTDGPGQEPAKKKYHATGWEMVPSLSHQEFASTTPSFPLGTRFMGDRYTWTYPLDLTGINMQRSPGGRPPPILTQDPVAASSWTFCYDPNQYENEDEEGGGMEFDVLASNRIFYQYLVRDRAGAADILMKFMKDGPHPS